MRTTFRALTAFITLFIFLLASPAFAADWQAKEIIAHYTITGDSGIALYRSIGENGLEIGRDKARRTIAVTEYDLKWRRDYLPQNGGCTLVSATPIMTITYRLPKPKGTLQGALAQSWQAFAGGIEAHERVHGQHLKEMVDAIITDTVGLTIDGDSACKTIRAQVLTRVKAAVETYKARARTFDGVEMGKGGNVERLILGLVNG